MTAPLSGQIAIVTGAGSGIGLEIAQTLAARGAKVLGVDMKPAEASGAGGDEIDGAGRIEPFSQDLLDDDAPQRVMDACKDTFGAPTILVNNAGIGAAKSLHLSDDKELKRYIDINLMAVMRLSRSFLEAVKETACIVNIASIYALVGFTNSAPYSASKAAIVGLTRQMAADYGRRNIRVNAVAPGLIVTPLTEERLAQNSDWFNTMLDSTPVGRLGQPSDIAKAVAFLCSPDASYITAEVLTVDGGWSSTRFFVGMLP